eukprot:818837-Alexandrium_andersonii.AAC.1
MSASLVGSEMCIRDSLLAPQPAPAGAGWFRCLGAWALLLLHCAGVGTPNGVRPFAAVSLPAILGASGRGPWPCAG